MILETTAEMKVPMPATAAAFQVNSAEFGGKGGRDFSIVAELMETLARLRPLSAGHKQIWQRQRVADIHDQSLIKKIAFHHTRIQ